MAGQKLYFIIDPDKSAVLASEFLVNLPSSTLIVEAMYAMDQGHISRGSELQNNLRNVLLRLDVTEQEIGVASLLMPELLPQSY
jgi:hypothetical protein